MNQNFEYITNLQYKVKALDARVKAFESGERYARMQSEFKVRLSEKDQETRRLKSELAYARRQAVEVRRNWLQVVEDLEKDYAKELKKKDRRIHELEERAWKAEGNLDAIRISFKEKNTELYQVMAELLEEQGKNQMLRAQINRDYENSSIASSLKPNHKKIPNSREKTNRNPGGQPGHVGHKRKRLSPTKRIHIPEPEKYKNSPDYRPTGKEIVKQIIGIRITVSVDEYYTKEFRNVKTGQRVHAEFPAGIRNEVNYAGSVKAFAFLLNNRCCVSIDKVREFLSELTDGELKISKGMINGLNKKFSEKTEAEQKKAFSDLLLSPVLSTDCTNARVNGQSMFVYICGTPDVAMYFARRNKGHKGVKGTPVEDYQGILVHDHDKTFYNYGSDHQECLAHILRYLKDSMENEPSLKWNKQMRELLQDMIHYRKGLTPEKRLDPDKVEGYEARYQEILDLAQKEYEYEPPSDYYREGYNLYRRLSDYMENHLLFLHNPMVPSDNNLSERLLRIYKRKQKQVMSLRSFDSLDYLCRSMSITALRCAKGENLYNNVAKIFD